MSLDSMARIYCAETDGEGNDLGGGGSNMWGGKITIEKIIKEEVIDWEKLEKEHNIHILTNKGKNQIIYVKGKDKLPVDSSKKSFIPTNERGNHVFFIGNVYGNTVEEKSSHGSFETANRA